MPLALNSERIKFVICLFTQLAFISNELLAHAERTDTNKPS